MWKHFTEWNHQNLFVFVNCFVLFCFSSNQRWFRRFDLNNGLVRNHYIDVITSTMTSQITSLTIVLLNRLFRRRSKKTSKLCVTGLCAGNSPVTGEFPAQRASNADNGSIWWHHHEATSCCAWRWCPSSRMAVKIGRYDVRTLAALSLT